MFEKRTLMATVAAFVVMFLLGWLLWGFLFMDTLSGMANPALAQFYEAPPNMPVLALSQLIMAWAMAVIFLKGYEGGPGVSEGMRFGLWVWILVGIPMGLGYVAFEMSGWSQMALESVLSLISYVAGGITIGMVLGGKGPASSMEHTHTTEV